MAPPLFFWFTQLYFSVILIDVFILRCIVWLIIQFLIVSICDIISIYVTQLFLCTISKPSL